MTAGRVEDGCEYADVVGDVTEPSSPLVDRAVAGRRGSGRADRRSIPGIGFGKTVGDNLDLLARLGELRASVSRSWSDRRESVSYRGGQRRRDHSPTATPPPLGACCAAALAGADIVRVHRVEGVRAALAVIDAIRGRRAIP